MIMMVYSQNSVPPNISAGSVQRPMVYKATVTTRDSNPISKTYHGMTGSTFTVKIISDTHNT